MPKSWKGVNIWAISIQLDLPKCESKNGETYFIFGSWLLLDLPTTSMSQMVFLITLNGPFGYKYIWE